MLCFYCYVLLDCQWSVQHTTWDPGEADFGRQSLTRESRTILGYYQAGCPLLKRFASTYTNTHALFTPKPSHTPHTHWPFLVSSPTPSPYAIIKLRYTFCVPCSTHSWQKNVVCNLVATSKVVTFSTSMIFSRTRKCHRQRSPTRRPWFFDRLQTATLLSFYICHPLLPPVTAPPLNSSFVLFSPTQLNKQPNPTHH